MKYIDIDCYERGCACASSNRFAGEQCEVVEIVRYKTLTNEEIEEIAKEFKDVDYTLDEEEAFDVFNHRGFARAILRKAQNG